MRTQRKYVNIQIDGHGYRVPSGMTILEAAKKNNIYIPTLCYLKGLTPFGGCRLCVVEISKMRGFPTSCTTPVAEGMQVKTKSKKLDTIRREILELTLSEHPFTCLTCKDKNDCSEFMHSTRKVGTITGCNFCTSNGDCEIQDLTEYLKIKDLKFPMHYRGLEPERTNPFYDLDYNLCVLCGRCVRICNEERNSGVLAFVQRGNETIVGTAFNESQQDAGCEYCGACVDVCPTGSISEKLGKWAGLPEKSVQTYCMFCSVGCTMNVNVRQNRIVNIGPKPGNRIHPYQLCIRGKFVPEDLVHHPERIHAPLIKKGDKWVEVSLKEAIIYTASQLARFKGSSFGIIGNAHDSMEDHYVMQKFARMVMQTNNADIHSSYPSKELIKEIHYYHNSFGALKLEDIQQSDTLMILGSDGSVTHPLVENKIRKAYRNNTHVIFCNAVKNRSTEFANTFVNYAAGTEQLLLTTLIAGLLKKKEGAKFQEMQENLSGFDSEEAMKRMGITKDLVSEILIQLMQSKQAIIMAGDGLLRNTNCMESFDKLINLQLLLGPSRCKGMMFLLSEGNLYGGTLAGLHPDYLPDFNSIKNHQSRKGHQAVKTGSDKQIISLTSSEMIESHSHNGLSSLFISGNIPARKKLAKFQFLVQHNMFLTETSKYAQVFFPAKSFMETAGSFIDIERKLKRTKPVIKAPDSSTTSGEILSAIAYAMQVKDFGCRTVGEQNSEMQSKIDLLFKSGPAFSKSPRSVSWTFSDSNPKTSITLLIYYNHYHYRGNILSGLIQDLKKISNENLLNISPDLARKLKVNNYDTVRVVTDSFISVQQVYTDTSLTNDIAYIKFNGEVDSFKSDLDTLNGGIIEARIEKY